MKRDFLPFAKFLFSALLAVSAFSAQAAEEKKAAKADVNKGQALYTNGDAAHSVPACASCHGEAGNSTISTNPKLAAQHEAYLAKQLTEFTKPERNNAVMTAIAKGLTAEDVKNVSAYLNEQKAKPGAAKNKDTIDAGKKIFRAGIAEKNVPACAGCHGATGAGMPSQYPRIAGQHFDYTVAQLTAFSKGTRKNNPVMMDIAKRMSEDDMKAVADYVAGLK
ncbi:MAG: cytochrome c4 [Burkholderiales bacterium]|nr:cytochrome c4 [Burkholderiales bacterium]